jgi:hypothetical protein
MKMKFNFNRLDILNNSWDAICFIIVAGVLFGALGLISAVAFWYLVTILYKANLLWLILALIPLAALARVLYVTYEPSKD